MFIIEPHVTNEEEARFDSGDVELWPKNEAFSMSIVNNTSNKLQKIILLH